MQNARCLAIQHAYGQQRTLFDRLLWSGSRKCGPLRENGLEDYENRPLLAHFLAWMVSATFSGTGSYFSNSMPTKSLLKDPRGCCLMASLGWKSSVWCGIGFEFRALKTGRNLQNCHEKAMFGRTAVVRTPLREIPQFRDVAEHLCQRHASLKATRK